jgi:hypothetical protein
VTNARGKNTRMGGSDPTFDGFQPPKPKWGRSRPPSSSGPCFVRVQESENTRRNAERKTNPTRRRRKATCQSLMHHPNNQSQ